MTKIIIMSDDIYISTYLGNRFYPLLGKIESIDIEDIAHGLAYQCRFNGQTKSFYSVAQHSLLVADMLPDTLKLAGLLHDAAEAYVGDMVKPLKLFIPEYEKIEKQVTCEIMRFFNLEDCHQPEIKKADMVLLATEKRDLMPNSTEPWKAIAGYEELTEKIVPMQPEEAKAEFLAAFFRYSSRFKA